MPSQTSLLHLRQPTELDRQLRLSEAVMRTKVMRQDEAVVRLGAPEESPLAQKVSPLWRPEAPQVGVAHGRRYDHHRCG